MNILITGGAGFIGSNIARYYLKKNHLVTIFDSLTRAEGAQNIVHLKKEFGNSLEFVSQDIRNYDAIAEVVRDQDVIFHCAGHIVSKTAYDHPRYDFEVNGLGTLNLLEACRAKNPRGIIMYTSSSKIYGDLSAYKKKRFSEVQPLDFATPNCCSIGSADQYVHDFSRSYGLKTVVFRLSPIYGEHQLGLIEDENIAYFLRSGIKSKPIIFHENDVFDPLYISDLIEAFDLAWKHIGTCSGQLFNIGGGLDYAVTASQLTALIEELINKKLILIPKRTNHCYISNNDKAKKMFGWVPTTTIRDGLTKTLNWLVNHLDDEAV
jgi:CDP-paratose 2-epimerase